MLVFCCLLGGFWYEVNRLNLQASVGGHVFSAFLCFALLLAPEWFFAFGLGDVLIRSVRARWARLTLPATLAIPYVIFSIPRHAFDWRYAVAMALFPVALSAVIEFSGREQKFIWQDAVVLLILAITLELRLFSPAWPFNGLGSLPKIYLADVALYVYVVVRRLEGIGYAFMPLKNAILVGLREWAFFLPLALGLGFALHFIKFIPRHPSFGHMLSSVLVVSLLTAVPEEIFFRGILQNLLEPRLGSQVALFVTAVLFGLSHFHKGAAFNWRYVILASVAGIFYGRAWRARKQLLASSTTHTLVDVVWGLWFR